MSDYDPRGTIRRFGPAGPLYEVLGEIGEETGRARARIRLLDSGEEAEYPVAQLLDDPVVA